VAHDLVYAPSGHACHLDDECRDCRGVEFPGEVVMVYDPAVRDLYVICEACYRRRLDRGDADAGACTGKKVSGDARPVNPTC
jgi:hypothetical protein